MAGLGVRIETVEKILNHASGSFRGIVSVYQRYDFSSEKGSARPLEAACCCAGASHCCSSCGRIGGNHANWR